MAEITIKINSDDSAEINHILQLAGLPPIQPTTQPLYKTLPRFGFISSLNQMNHDFNSPSDDPIKQLPVAPEDDDDELGGQPVDLGDMSDLELGEHAEHDCINEPEPFELGGDNTTPKRRPDVRITSGYGDNALAENTMNATEIYNAFQGYVRDYDESTAIGKTAEELGIPAEEVKDAVDRLRDSRNVLIDTLEQEYNAWSEQ